jgi:Domain of unknown function (DUF6457)
MQLRHKRPDHTARTEEAENGATDALDTWITELATTLGVDATTIDHKQILELSRSTHRVARAAAPFTLLLTGMAAGRRRRRSRSCERSRRHGATTRHHTRAFSDRLIDDEPILVTAASASTSAAQFRALHEEWHWRAASIPDELQHLR